MATINRSTQLFDDLSDDEARELQRWVEGVVLQGVFPIKHPELIDQWLVTFHHLSEQTLLIISTALPQRVLMSLLVKRDQEFYALCRELHTAPAFGHKGVMDSITSLVSALDLAVGAPT